MFGRAEQPEPEVTREAVSLAIASGKGGTGKSFLATNLAVVLHQFEHDVTLVDCDFGLACDHLLMGVSPKQTLAHVLGGQTDLDGVSLATPAGPRLIPGASGVRKMADLSDRQLQALGVALGEAACGCDALLLDIGAGLSPQNILTVLAADYVLIVTQPEIAALTDAYALIKSCAQLHGEAKFLVVVNRVAGSGDGEATFDKLAAVTQRHTGVELHFLGAVGEDPSVTQRRLNQAPIVVSDPGCATARAIEVVADRLIQCTGRLALHEVAVAKDMASRFGEYRLFLG